MTNIATIQRLNVTIAAIAPIDGISVGTFGAVGSVRIDFSSAATQTQKDNANAALASFDWSDAATQTWLQAQQNPNLTTLISQATTSITNNNIYLGLSNPTQAQAIAQVQALTNQINKIIKVLANILT